MKRVDELVEETSTPIATFNGISMETQFEPHKHRQRKFYLNGVSIEILKFLKNIIVENDVTIEGEIRVHMHVSCIE